MFHPTAGGRKAIDGLQDQLRFRSSADASGAGQFLNEAFRNALARMNLLPRPLVDGSQHECPDARIHRLSIR